MIYYWIKLGYIVSVCQKKIAATKSDFSFVGAMRCVALRCDRTLLVLLLLQSVSSFSIYQCCSFVGIDSHSVNDLGSPHTRQVINIFMVHCVEQKVLWKFYLI